ncbi:transcription antitermination factor NusB [Nocardia donostiensis]|uniref:transcription antitermination factor NusB n=1 Tax=Nocardia donostiensis TaxID=1538463 RepID=UPI0009DAB2DE|nr:transcription antitermination factor NusB [Nocardia donostiensis]
MSADQPQRRGFRRSGNQSPEPDASPAETSHSAERRDREQSSRDSGRHGDNSRTGPRRAAPRRFGGDQATGRERGGGPGNRQDGPGRHERREPGAERPARGRPGGGGKGRDRDRPAPQPERGKASGAGRAAGRGKNQTRSARETVDAARRVALDTLRAVRERDAYANLVLPALLRERRVTGRDAALATELGYGACRTLGVLDAVIAECAGRDIEQIDGPLLDVLRLGVYQLLRTRIGAHAAVDTSVALVRAESGAGKAGFVNAVLRQAARRSPEEWVDALAPRDPVGRLAFEFAHPAWIAQAFADALGADAVELRDLLAADDARPTVHLVARPGEITAEELALVTGGEEGALSPYAVHLDGGDPAALEPVREGMAAVQDEGSQLVAIALTRAPLEGADGGRWLDLCAGPGGKAALLGALAAIDRFHVDAVEPAEHRAELVRKTTRDLPVAVHIADGRNSGLTPGYDRVLVDAPCTGLGALRRRPEARWRRTPADVAELVVLQRELLNAAWELLRPGGVLVYSTCSPHLPETVAVVADTVRRTGAVELDTRELLPGVTDIGPGPAVQLWPHRHGTDAMFLAALRKPR